MRAVAVRVGVGVRVRVIRVRVRPNPNPKLPPVAAAPTAVTLHVDHDGGDVCVAQRAQQCGEVR